MGTGAATATTTDGPAPRARTGPWAWVAVLAVAVFGSLGFAAVDRPPDDGFGTAAEALLPADGAAVVTTVSDGRRWVVETAITTGTTAPLQLPAVAGEQVLVSLGDAATSTRFLRSVLTDPDGALAQRSELSTIDRDGIRLRAVTGLQDGVVYTPGLLVLPADVHDGATWSSEGEALPGDRMRYRSESTARVADSAAAGCLEVETTTVYTEPADGGAELRRVHDVSVWCPGAGVVSATVELDGERFEVTSGELVGGAPAADPADRAWPAATGWSASTPGFVLVDPLFGENPLPLAVASPAAATDSGTAVLVVDDDLEAWRADGDRQVRAWVAHPGGVVVAVGAVGDLVFATTSERSLVAYGDDGDRRWSARFDDVLLEPPVSDGDGGLVAVALDGEVRRLDAVDGRERWTARLGADAEAGALVADGLVVVGSRDGVVTALDLATGDERWSAVTEPVGALGLVDGTVVVGGITGGVVWHDLATGAERFEDRRAGVISRFESAGDVVVGLHAEGITAWGSDGEARWTQQGLGYGLAGDGDVVAALGPAGVRAFAPDGAELGAWAVPGDRPGVTRVLLGRADGVWVVGSDHSVTALGGP